MKNQLLTEVEECATTSQAWDRTITKTLPHSRIRTLSTSDDVSSRKLQAEHHNPTSSLENKPAGTRGDLHFKIAPGSRWFGTNQGQFQMNRGQFSKYISMLQKHINKVWTQRDRFSMVYIMKTSKITPEGKFTTNVRISVIYYSFVTGAFWQQIVAPGSWFFIAHGRNG